MGMPQVSSCSCSMLYFLSEGDIYIFIAGVLGDPDITLKSNGSVHLTLSSCNNMTNSTMTTQSSNVTNSNMTTQSSNVTNSNMTTQSSNVTNSNMTTQSSNVTNSNMTTQSSNVTNSNMTTQSPIVTNGNMTTQSSNVTNSTSNVPAGLHPTSLGKELPFNHSQMWPHPQYTHIISCCELLHPQNMYCILVYLKCYIMNTFQGFLLSIFRNTVLRK